MTLPVRVVFKNKKNSSGWIKDGEIILAISSRLNYRDQQTHITTLARRLQAMAARQAQRSPLDMPPGPITDDRQLAELAAAINREHYGFALDRIRFWRQKSRWGSCMVHKREIHISHRLKGAPLPLLEYVVVHELCHLKEANHGRRFWRLVEQACFDYRERRRLLAVYGEAGLAANAPARAAAAKEESMS
ncbi:MAG: M48 family metallopeptidase [Bacillota bacterium]